MKTHWYMKHPIIFGLLIPIVGVEAASILSMLLQLPIYAAIGNGILKYRHLPGILFDLSRILVGLGIILIMKPRLWKGYKAGFSNDQAFVSIKFAALASLMVISNIIENGVVGGLPAADTPVGILSGILNGIAPGFYEEMVCRGVVLSLMMYCFQKKIDRITRSVVLSGLCFGIVHLLNLLSADIVMTLIQVCYAAAVGIFFGGIYVRTRNLWGPVIFHSLIDIAEFIYIGDAGFTSYVLVSSIAIIIIYSALGLYLIRPAKRGEIEELWSDAADTREMARAEESV